MASKAETGKLILKLIWNYKGIQKPKTTLKSLKTKIFYLKTSYIQFNTIVTKTVELAQDQRSRPMEQNRAAATKSLQLCLTLCDPIDSNPQGSSIHGVFQARVLEWGAIAFSNRIESPEEIHTSLDNLFSRRLSRLFHGGTNSHFNKECWDNLI